jgi:hypothetical protein
MHPRGFLEATYGPIGRLPRGHARNMLSENRL